jgi:hypothetical protein
MLVRIHYTLGDDEDSIVLRGDSVEEIRALAEEAVSSRGGSDPWSEVLEE